MQQKTVHENLRTIVYYHGPHCLDGGVAAWVVAKYVEKFNGSVELRPVDYSDDVTTLPQDCRIFVVDFTFPDYDFFKQLIDHNEIVIHYDHHPSARETLASLQEEFSDERYHAVFTEEFSGAGITWRELFPGLEVPDIVKWVEDRDLWRFHYPETKAFTEAFYALDRSPTKGPFNSPLLQACDYANDPVTQRRMVVAGEGMIKKRLERCCKQIEEETCRIPLLMPDGSRKIVPFSKAKDLSDFSDQSNLMIEKGLGSIVGTYFVKKGGVVKVRISTDKSTPVAYKIAQEYGGGGHPHTAGFEVERKVLPGLF